jgi:hypothetical protein
MLSVSGATQPSSSSSLYSLIELPQIEDEEENEDDEDDLHTLRRFFAYSRRSCIARGWWNDKRLCTTTDSKNSQNFWWNIPFV